MSCEGESKHPEISQALKNMRMWLDQKNERIAHLESQNKILREGLEFYAEPTNYVHREVNEQGESISVVYPDVSSKAVEKLAQADAVKSEGE